MRCLGGVAILLYLGCSPPVSSSGAGNSSCRNGAVSCRGATMVLHCVDNQWEEQGACEQGLFCIDGECSDDGCPDGVRRCELGRREICDNEGTNWSPDPCAEGTTCRGDGECSSANCEAGAFRCADIEGERWPQRERCADDGSEWQNAACRRGTVCINDGDCRPMECLPGSTGCADDRTVGRCNDDGTAIEPTETCPDGSACSSGSCMELCRQARMRQSYDGCVFFAVDVGNAPYRVGAVDPFAITLANPHDFEVTVRITSSGDRVVQAAGTVRVPGADGYNEANERIGYTTVHSYVEDTQGRRRNVSGPVDGVAIPAGGMGVFLLPKNTAGVRILGSTVTYQSELENRAYKVVASAPVTAYQFSPICCSHSYSNDASILFPAGSQGREYVGVSLPYQNRMQGRAVESPSFLSVVASDEGAEVEIDLGNRQIEPVHGQDRGHFRIQIEPYQVLTMISANTSAARSDLTGVQITASSEVAVFGGHTCTEIPHDNPACDHVETSLMPVETWRNEYLGTHTHYRSSNRNEVNYYRVVASREGASINFDPPLTSIATHGTIASGLPDCRSLARGDSVTLDAMGWCEFGTRSNFLLRSDRPVQMVQFISSQTTTGIRGYEEYAGDPAMTAVPALEQYRSQYTFLTPDTYQLNFVNIIHPEGAILELDGISVTLGAMGNPGRTPFIEVDSQPIGTSSGWALTIVRLDSGQHTIESATMERFGIMVYAYDDYVSYAFPGGLDLAKR